MPEMLQGSGRIAKGWVQRMRVQRPTRSFALRLNQSYELASVCWGAGSWLHDKARHHAGCTCPPAPPPTPTSAFFVCRSTPHAANNRGAVGRNSQGMWEPYCRVDPPLTLRSRYVVPVSIVVGKEGRRHPRVLNSRPHAPPLPGLQHATGRNRSSSSRGRPNHRRESHLPGRHRYFARHPFGESYHGHRQ